jgi:hypothetical protein
MLSPVSLEKAGMSGKTGISGKTGKNNKEISYIKYQFYND